MYPKTTVTVVPNVITGGERYLGSKAQIDHLLDAWLSPNDKTIYKLDVILYGQLPQLG